jgi:hypothetical protein
LVEKLLAFTEPMAMSPEERREWQQISAEAADFRQADV